MLLGVSQRWCLENPRWWRPPSWITENVDNSELDRVICAKFGGQVHHGHPEMTHDQKSLQGCRELGQYVRELRVCMSIGCECLSVITLHERISWVVMTNWSDECQGRWWHFIVIGVIRRLYRRRSICGMHHRLLPSIVKSVTCNYRLQNHTMDYRQSACCNPLDSKRKYSATSNNTWAVTFGTARRGLGGLQPRPVPSSLYQM